MTLETFTKSINKENRKPATLKQIADFEKSINCKLPEDYKHFLMSTAGGSLITVPFYTIGSLHEGVLWMLGLTDNDYPSRQYSLEEKIQNPDFYPLPKGLMNIGSDTSGNPISICLLERRFGEVFINDDELFSFDHSNIETIEEAEEYGLAMFAASSFTSFVQMMKFVRTFGDI